jgi:hypothetical protein
MPHNNARPDAREDSIKSPIVGIFFAECPKTFFLPFLFLKTIRAGRVFLGFTIYGK